MSNKRKNDFLGLWRVEVTLKSFSFFVYRFYFSPRTNPSKYANQTNWVTVQRSAKNWPSHISSLGYLWLHKYELYPVWVAFNGSWETNPSKYANQTNWVTVQRSAKNWASHISSLGYLWLHKYELYPVWVAFNGSWAVYRELRAKGIYAFFFFFFFFNTDAHIFFHGSSAFPFKVILHQIFKGAKQKQHYKSIIQGGRANLQNVLQSNK